MFELNSLQNVYFELFPFYKFMEWCHFVTYLSNDSRTKGYRTVDTETTKISIKLGQLRHRERHAQGFDCCLKV